MVPSTLANASDTDAVPSLALVVVESVVVVVSVVGVVVVGGDDTGRAFGVFVVDVDADADDEDVPATLAVVTKLTTSATLLCCIEAKSNFLPYNPNEIPSIATVTKAATDNHGNCFRLLLISSSAAAPAARRDDE
jgi:hypothetical protein